MGLNPLHNVTLRPVESQRHKVWLQNRLVVGSIPTQGSEILHLYNNTFICSFLRSGVEAKRGVEFRQSAHNASRIRRKLPNLLCAGNCVKLILITFTNVVSVALKCSTYLPSQDHFSLVDLVFVANDSRYINHYVREVIYVMLCSLPWQRWKIVVRGPTTYVSILIL